MVAHDQRPLLLTCLGDNPASAIVAGRHFSVGAVLAIVTARTRKLMEVVGKQLGTPIECLEHDAESEGFTALAYRIRDALSKRAPSGLVVDITGGTKLMGMGAFIGAELLRKHESPVLYLKANGRLADARSGSQLRCEVSISPQEVLAWYGARITRHSWLRPAKHGVPGEILERRALSHFLFERLGHKELKLAPNERGAIELQQGQWPEPLPRGVERLSETIIHAPGLRYLKFSGWLEELCLLRAHAVARGATASWTAYGCHVAVTSQSTDLDEVDVIVVRGARVCAIEAKAKFSSESAGAELQKRIHKTRRFLGQQAKVIFVHPAWGKNVPADLERSSGAGVYLIGNDLTALDKAVAEALDL
jgi:hypothetical protein